MWDIVSYYVEILKWSTIFSVNNNEGLVGKAYEFFYIYNSEFIYLSTSWSGGPDEVVSFYLFSFITNKSNRI